MLALLLAVVAPGASAALACAANGGGDLKAHLLEDYDPTIIPDAPLALEIHPSILKIQVNAADKTVDVVAWWRHYWTDARLSWDPKDWNNVTEFVAYHEEDKEIWVPDTGVLESSPSEYTYLSDVNSATAQVSHEGRVFLSRPLHLTLFCDMDLALFPFDKQRCDFTVGAWAYDGLGVEIWPSRGGRDLRDSTWLDLDSLGEIEEYDLVKVLADRAETYYSCCPGTPYYALRYTLVLKRRSRFYIWCLMFPLFMSTLIGFLTFLVNPAAGERIGLGITVVLTIVAILWIVVDILPKNNVVTFLQKIYLSSFATALLTLMVSIVTVSLCLVTSEDNGMKSRRTLLDAFFSADEDNDGVLDQHELRKAVRSLGLSDKEMKQVLRLCGRDPVPFDVWDAVVDKICQANVFATSHNFLIGGLLKHFIDREHRRRVGAVKRRSLMKQRASSISPEPRTDAPPRPPRLDDAGSTKALDATDSTRSVVGADSARSVVGGSEGDLLGALTDGIFRPPGDDGGGDPGEKYEWNPPLERFDSGRSSVFLADKGVVEENDTKELTEEIGRALAGKIDMAAGLLLPALYIGYVFFLCLDLGFPLPGHVPKASVEVLYNASQPTVLYY